MSPLDFPWGAGLVTVTFGADLTRATLVNPRPEYREHRGQQYLYAVSEDQHHTAISVDAIRRAEVTA